MSRFSAYTPCSARGRSPSGVCGVRGVWDAESAIHPQCHGNTLGAVPFICMASMVQLQEVRNITDIILLI